MSDKEILHEKMLRGLEALKRQVEIQCQNGVWNYDSYLHGVANGLIWALATMKGEKQEFLEAPDEWLCDLPLPKETTTVKPKGE